ncbi:MULTISPECIES: acyl carrier protein [unclassified Bartonella]|uniref:acyl carrier protein n=1 Tax=unclassified Bartonella TaxID=2645622 RepID=UPI0035D09FD8
MYITKISQIFKDVMYLDESEELDPHKSLFSDYGMTSIDYIDFAFELKKHFKVDVSPESLWPVNKWATTEAFYSFDTKEWTSEGVAKINDLLGLKEYESIDKKIQFKELYSYFTLNYINQRISVLKRN